MHIYFPVGVKRKCYGFRQQWSTAININSRHFQFILFRGEDFPGAAPSENIFIRISHFQILISACLKTIICWNGHAKRT